MDLEKFDTTAAEEGADLELLDPTGKPLLDEETQEPWTLHLVGQDSKEYRSTSHRLINRRVSRARRNGAAGLRQTAEELEQDAIELLATCVKGWQHLKLGGQALPYSHDNAVMLLTRFPFIREQVDGFVNDRANFLGN